MFSHIHTGVSDFERAFTFYSVVLKELGLVLRFKEEDLVTNIHWAGWQTPDVGRPLFLIGKPFDKEAHLAGNGQMVAFLASSRAQVRRVYDTALANGGVSEGPPGLRPHYHANYYGAYFRDTEGNKVGVACHEAEST
jgi:catechol 2,3-dioxygenase-like lactoylglutathione lyase family enzyme